MILPLLLFALAPPDAGTLLILHKGASSLGFYSADGRLEVSVPLAPHPHEMVFSPDRRFVYITENGTLRIEEAGAGGNTVAVVDTTGRKKTSSVALGKYHRPHGIALDARTGRLLVSTELPDQLLLIDPAAGKVLKTYETQGKTSHMVTLDAEGRWAYVSNSGSGNVSAVELASGRVKLIPTGDRPEGSVLAADGKHVYIANRESHTIAVIDTAKQELAGRIPTGKGPVRIACTPEGLLVYALFHDRAVGFADSRTNEVVGHVALPAGAPLVSMHLSSDGRFAYTSAEEEDKVFVISVSDRKLIRTISTAAGARPDPAAPLR